MPQLLDPSKSTRTLERQSDDPVLADALRDAFLTGLDLSPDADVTTLTLEGHPHWDSLGHMSLVAAIERRFGITLTSGEVTGLDSYAAATTIVGSRQPRRSEQAPNDRAGR